MFSGEFVDIDILLYTINLYASSSRDFPIGCLRERSILSSKRENIRDRDKIFLVGKMIQRHGIRFPMVRIIEVGYYTCSGSMNIFQERMYV